MTCGTVASATHTPSCQGDGLLQASPHPSWRERSSSLSSPSIIRTPFSPPPQPHLNSVIVNRVFLYPLTHIYSHLLGGRPAAGHQQITAPAPLEFTTYWRSRQVRQSQRMTQSSDGGNTGCQVAQWVCLTRTGERVFRKTSWKRGQLSWTGRRGF